ncbi:SDR family NAD(P)-dependent oxidoreductase [Streptomyces boluensis]|uniref:SDR family oxidoreductase n=1 Tax=Streptomyces boluensis TaxID=1775135 RepID=A0A964UVN7_9ACTN|nr:SDR family oxidoreductase [Streptomyces boluensis]NBE55587.1 SDR family oxidoreductase [Streptomyces boluensis]
MSTYSFEGRSTIVTGAASGIGRAAALGFARRGAKVLVADLQEEQARRVVEGIEGAGGTALAVVGDLSEQQVVDRVAATAAEEFGGIDILVNNAGVMDRMSRLGETEDAEWERTLRINLTAPFLLTRAVLPHMTRAGRGSLVFTASEASLRGGVAGASYTAAKHGLVGLVKSVAATYRDSGIRANAIGPGPTSTGIQVDIAPDSPGAAALAPVLGLINGVSTPEQQAAAILFLASEEASFINGAVLPVDGGWAAL